MVRILTILSLRICRVARCRGGMSPGLRPTGLAKGRNESSAGLFAVLEFRARNLTCPLLRREVECPVSGEKVRPESFPPFLVARLFTVKSRRGSGVADISVESGKVANWLARDADFAPRIDKDILPIMGTIRATGWRRRYLFRRETRDGNHFHNASPFMPRNS